MAWPQHLISKPLEYPRRHQFLFTVITLTMALASHAQEARFIALNSDTFVNNAIVCSPDGKNIYAAGSYSIAVFERGSDDSLEVLQMLNNDHLGLSGIHHVIDLAMAPDGRFLYAVTPNDQSLLLFTRDASSGLITLAEVFVDSAFGLIRGSVRYTESYYRLLMSSDGKNIYWLSNATGAFAVFARDVDTGYIKRLQFLKKGDVELGAFNLPRWFALTPDGRHVYAGGGNQTKILIMSRESVSGQLFFQGSYDLGQSSLDDGRWAYGSITLAPNGRRLYITNRFSNQLFVMTRNDTSGMIYGLQTINHTQPSGVVTSPKETHIYVRHFDTGGSFAIYTKDVQTGNLVYMEDFQTRLGFQPPAGISMSPLGDEIYLTSQSGPSVIKRDAVTGRLAFSQLLGNNIGGTDLLYGSRFVEVSPDGNFVYVAATDADEGISVFSRDPSEGRLTLAAAYPLEGLQHMALSPEGNYVYAFRYSFPSDEPWGSLAIFRRDWQSGKLELTETIRDSATLQFSTIGPKIFSADGRRLYIGDRGSINFFEREVSTGALRFVRRLQSRNLRFNDLPLGNMQALALSPDERHLYWAGETDSFLSFYVIATLARDPASGEWSASYVKDIGKIKPLGAMRISADGENVFLTSEDCDEYYSDVAAAFSRDAVTGELTYRHTFTLEGMCDGRDIAISRDGSQVYLAAGSSGVLTGVVAMLERSPATDQLLDRAIFRSWENGVYGISEPRALALSPDEKHLYMADLTGVSTFATGRGAASAIADKNSSSRLPRTLTLEQNYPNPFSTSSNNATPGQTTTIRYEIPHADNGSIPVNLAVYNTQGQLVQTLVNEIQSPGQHSITWQGVNAHGKRMPSGIYFYRVKAGKLTATKRLLIVN